jgi:hypothetical protein
MSTPRVRATMTIEKTTPTTVITAAAMAMRTWRPASAPPLLSHGESTIRRSWTDRSS